MKVYDNRAKKRGIIPYVLCTMICASILLAQAGNITMDESRVVPKLLNYQGYLTDTSGIPIDDTLNMAFGIYDSATVGTGNKLWSEMQTAVPIERGVFSVLLGSVIPIPDSVFEATDRWLELTVDAQALSPRTRITSVGYAYTSTYSDTSEYARNVTADADWTISGNVLYPGADYGLSMRSINVMHGINDSTHVCFGVACTTGASGQNNEFCTVSGGEYNVARGSHTTVSGGYSNVASGVRATVSGGYENTASGSHAVIGGGYQNDVSGILAAVGGGQLNTASGYAAIVGGGYGNTASSNYTVVGGGVYNYASNYFATIGGGYADTVAGRYGGILSGYSNLAGDALEDTAATAEKIISDIVEILERERIKSADVRLRQTTLEDVFIHLTGRRLRE